MKPREETSPEPARRDSPSCQETVEADRDTKRESQGDCAETREHTAGPAPQTSGDESLPSQFGRYRVLRRLGGGSFGTVYEARDDQLDRAVAVKVPRARDSDTFRREARLLAGIRHPGIVAAYDFGVSDQGSCYLVCELVEGETLADRMQREPLSQSGSLALGAACAEALHHAHTQGVIHRDIKPANLLLDNEGQPRIADFGLALHESEQRQRPDEVSGSPSYMAPEQVSGRSQYLDGRTDIWSLGVVLYQLLTGRRPFSGDSRQELFDDILHRDPKPLRLIDETIAAETETVVLKCLEKRPVDRYSTAADLAAALRSCLAPTDVATQPTESNSAREHGPTNVRSYRTAVPLAAIMFVAVVAALAGWYAVRNHMAGGGPAAGPSVVRESTAPPLVADVDFRVEIWNVDQPSRRGVPVTRSGILPLRSGEQVFVEVAASQKLYFYIVWLGSDSGLTPLYPWPIGEWSRRPQKEEAKLRLHLPIGTVNPTPATETVLLLARQAPLPSSIDVRTLLAEFPQPNLLGTPATPASRTRGITFGTATADDRAESARQFLENRLQPHFDIVRAVSFASGETDAGGLISN